MKSKFHIDREIPRGSQLVWQYVNPSTVVPQVPRVIQYCRYGLGFSPQARILGSFGIHGRGHEAC